MVKWASIIFSSIALALLGVAGLAIGVANTECLGSIRWFPLAPECVMFLAVNTGATLYGLGLTVLVLIVHLIVAAKKRTWGWFITLLVMPPLSFFGVLSVVNSDGDPSATIVVNVGFFTLIGLPNLLFGLSVLKSTRWTARASPFAELPPS